MNTSKVAGALGSLLAISALVVHTSNAAFTATTDNSGNNWEAGTVLLSDDDAGAAMFNASELKPGSTDAHCIVVTYDGDLAADVRLRSSVVDGGLGAFLDLTVERGTAPAAGCTGFVADETVYTGTLAGLAAAHSSFATGAGTWAPTGAGEFVTYRFVWTLQDDNDAQGEDVQSTFTWEAQNS